VTGRYEASADRGSRRGRATLVFVALFLSAALLAVYFVPRELRPHVTGLEGLELLVFGIVVGAYGTMVGAGGGFLVVPALLLVYHARPEQAAGTSLVVVFLNAASGSASYVRQKRVDYRAGVIFGLATLPGAVAGAFLSRLFTGRAFDIVFGSLLLGIAGLLLWRPLAEEELAASLAERGDTPWWRVETHMTDRSGETFTYGYNLWKGIALSFGTGFVSSILGIGGGIIHVPGLIHLLLFPAHVATATSHFILAISSAVGAGTHLLLGDVLIAPALLMGVGVAGGAQAGALLARRLRGSMLVRMLSMALILVALRLLLR
jgi:uncharacterized protein